MEEISETINARLVLAIALGATSAITLGVTTNNIMADSAGALSGIIGALVTVTSAWVMIATSLVISEIQAKR